MAESIEDTISRVCGESGSCMNMYGGFEITVCDAATFPWTEVFEALLAIQHHVWIIKKEDCLQILSKPPTA